MSNLTAEERALLNRLSESDSLEPMPGVYTESKGIGAKLGGIMGNPIFKSQFDLSIRTQFTKAGVVILPAALDVTLQNQIPAFIFGTSDMSGGFRKVQSFFPTSGWVYSGSGIVGYQGYGTSCTIAVTGDLVISYAKTIGPDVYVAYVVINCPQVAYGTLMDSISSDKIYLNMIRYVVDPGQTKQLKNQILYVIQSLLGKTQNDYVSPQTFITGQTYNRNIADIPIEFGVDKNLILGTWIDYDVQQIDWTLTVYQTQKIKA